MSRIAFSGYIALTWPPGSDSASRTATRMPAESGVVRSEETGRAGTDNEDVGLDGLVRRGHAAILPLRARLNYNLF